MNDKRDSDHATMLDGLYWWVCRTVPATAPQNVIGGDVACLMPTKDSPNKITSLGTAAIMFEIIRLVADNIKT